MSNQSLFQSASYHITPANVVNGAGGLAYTLSDEHALTQYALTGTFGDSFYVSARVQLEEMLKLCGKVDHEFIAQLALYARAQGYMKDTPVFLLAYLSNTDYPKLKNLFKLIVTDGGSLRTYVQIIRSGQTGRKSLGHRLKRMCGEFLNTASERTLLNASIGNDPSLVDVLKMVHVHPSEPWRRALFGWLMNKEFNPRDLPQACKDYDEFKSKGINEGQILPQVPFLMLSSLPLNIDQWKYLVTRMSWKQVLKNLNTFTRKELFKDEEVVLLVAEALRKVPERTMPYEVLAAFIATRGNVPQLITDALHDVMLQVVGNVPDIPGRTLLACDISMSMSWSITGDRATTPSTIRCVDVAALMTSALLSRNKGAGVVAFNQQGYNAGQHMQETDIFTNTKLLSDMVSGGTDCSVPFQILLQNKLVVDTVIMFSDNESWITDQGYGRSALQSPTLRYWNEYKKLAPACKLICIDITPKANAQIHQQPDVYNIGGFSDNVFKIVSAIIGGVTDPEHLVKEVKQVVIGE